MINWVIPENIHTEGEEGMEGGGGGPMVWNSEAMGWFNGMEFRVHEGFNGLEFQATTVSQIEPQLRSSFA